MVRFTYTFGHIEYLTFICYFILWVLSKKVQIINSNTTLNHFFCMKRAFKYWQIYFLMNILSLPQKALLIEHLFVTHSYWQQESSCGIWINNQQDLCELVYTVKRNKSIEHGVFIGNTFQSCLSFETANIHSSCANGATLNVPRIFSALQMCKNW